MKDRSLTRNVVLLVASVQTPSSKSHCDRNMAEDNFSVLSSAKQELVDKRISIISLPTTTSMRIHPFNSTSSSGLWWGRDSRFNNTYIQFRFSLFLHAPPCIYHYLHRMAKVIEIDSKIEVSVVSPTTWEAHHSPGRWWYHNDRIRSINFYSIMMPQGILNLCRF